MKEKFCWAMVTLFLLIPLLMVAENSGPSNDLSATIDYLIGFVDSSGLTFIRNGRSHDAHAAASHIRSKYEHFKDSIKTPEEFIEKSATKSLMTDRDYVVVLPDGTQRKVRDWLMEELQRYLERLQGNIRTIPGFPEALKVPATQVLSLATQATGVQIYECEASKDDPMRFEWVFKAPEAELFDSAGKRIGRHYTGPIWEANDGSKVVGEVRARDNGPDPNAIPWLLLSAKSTSGNGVFSQTQSIQRIHTAGGKAPEEGCNQSQVGKETRVPYKAKYYFYIDRQ